MSQNLLGGIGLTHLTVYQYQAGPDGIHAGCAHIHALTPEAYFGISGEGAVEVHDLKNGYRCLPIKKGTFVQFQPGTLHRSISTNHLEVLAIMGNGGLAERGDARIYFGKEVDDAAEEYNRLKGLTGQGLGGAMARRDASAKAYSQLMGLWASDKPAYFLELSRFMDVHQNQVQNEAGVFQKAIEDGPVAAGQQALQGLATLCDPGFGLQAVSALVNVAANNPVLGMCGELRQIEGLNSA